MPRTAPLSPVQRRRTRPSGSGTGIVLKSSPSTALKSAVLAPMPKASEANTTSAQPLAFRTPRIAERMS